MPEKSPLIATLLLSCPDQKGLVAKISDFIFRIGGNILNLDEHVDREEKRFFIRLEWDYEGPTLKPEEFNRQFSELGKEISAAWEIHDNSNKQKLAIFVSKYEHCIQEILWLNSIGELQADIRLIISNHMDLEYLAKQYNIPFHYFPIDRDKRTADENRELALLKENAVETIILARYMQVLSENFVRQYPSRIINIHHSFLPAFMGANPYKQAYDKGVKIIGATCHYVTEMLDEGPIIEQGVTRISHSDSLKDLISKGRELERSVLTRGLKLHISNRVLSFGNKTIIFE